jgi:hypothetical protein
VEQGAEAETGDEVGAEAEVEARVEARVEAEAGMASAVLRLLRMLIEHDLWRGLGADEEHAHVRTCGGASGRQGGGS